ncbi:sulfurtransferase-like selenium metabolism protein YedF [Bacillus dakarensis]|uniref:sulfurtransferase-like selenium metabolism protein YedF n=1 Tax=Robertmurraya dakarensis TaxID=1926278 RepID=UPI0009824572|nr:sulfurtransferase-like selenium metabolism protein YedF [Bacillus dakarensis]
MHLQKEIHIPKNNIEVENVKNKVILLASDQLGKGEKELGEGILETFFTILKQKEELPAAVFCMNRGVFALTEYSLVSLQLKELEEKGVDILACKTCVDYYELEDKLAVGEISGMAQFIELASKYEVMTLS